jgi:signal transduction histidine kinase
MWLVDAALAVALTVAGLAAASGFSDALPMAYAVVAVHTLALAFRRVFPVAVLATMVVTGALLPFLGVPPFVPGPVILLAVYTVAATRPLALSVGGLVASCLALVVQGLDAGGTATWALIMTGSWMLGHYVRTRRLYAAELEERAAQLERAQAELAHQAVAAERLRIARELHDVVAHAMSVIAVQAGVGAHVIDAQPEEARRALAAIEVASRGGLAELRRLLGVLRDDTEAQASRLPTPGLADVEALVTRTAEAGVEVDVSIEGERSVLPPGVDLAVYRIVQEALTNVVKHAGVARARVVVSYGPADVAVEVTDEGRGGSPNGTGHGIAGMRERAALYGGTIDVGPRPGGGFRVAARVPIAPSA